MAGMAPTPNKVWGRVPVCQSPGSSPAFDMLLFHLPTGTLPPQPPPHPGTQATTHRAMQGTVLPGVGRAHC